MLGLLVITLASWVLLHFLAKENLSVLGVFPIGKGMIQFGMGLVFIMAITLVNIYVETIVLNVDWQWQTDIHYPSIFDAFVYHLRSALTEDLVFRGAILYILIKRLGSSWAIFISALCFGVYHVFSYGIAGGGNILTLFVVITTGFTGYVWAYTFSKSKSIMLGLGFHLGVNMMNSFFFESQPYGELIFRVVSKTPLADWDAGAFSLFKGFFPAILSLLFVKYILRTSLYFRK
ncbi:CPBP family intramembrane metalloprotease [Cryomorphaceae bacterium 1068]|nr:CPBP family intramembrane metalloprotease [Cryomorphaceae bacterium 1068]